MLGVSQVTNQPFQQESLPEPRRISASLVAQVLDGIIRAANNSERDNTIVNGNFKIKNISYPLESDYRCHFSASPARICHQKKKGDEIQAFQITNLNNQASIEFTELALDWLRYHRSFSYLDPEKVAECLELDTTEYSMIVAQSLVFHLFLDPEPLAEEIAKQYAFCSIPIDANATAYILPYENYLLHHWAGKTVKDLKEAGIVFSKFTLLQLQIDCMAMNGLENPSEITQEMVYSLQIQKEINRGIFLHVFNQVDRSKNDQIKRAATHLFENPIQKTGITIFKMETATYADIPRKQIRNKIAREVPSSKRPAPAAPSPKEALYCTFFELDQQKELDASIFQIKSFEIDPHAKAFLLPFRDGPMEERDGDMVFLHIFNRLNRTSQEDQIEQLGEDIKLSGYVSIPGIYVFAIKMSSLSISTK